MEIHESQPVDYRWHIVMMMMLNIFNMLQIETWSTWSVKLSTSNRFMQLIETMFPFLRVNIIYPLPKQDHKLFLISHSLIIRSFTKIIFEQHIQTRLAQLTFLSLLSMSCFWIFYTGLLREERVSFHLKFCIMRQSTKIEIIYGKVCRHPLLYDIETPLPSDYPVHAHGRHPMGVWSQGQIFIWVTFDRTFFRQKTQHYKDQVHSLTDIEHNNRLNRQVNQSTRFAA